MLTSDPRLILRILIWRLATIIEVLDIIPNVKIPKVLKMISFEMYKTCAIDQFLIDLTISGETTNPYRT